jgi:hypothetical protein
MLQERTMRDLEDRAGRRDGNTSRRSAFPASGAARSGGLGGRLAPPPETRIKDEVETPVTVSLSIT